jgi:hypothetical protein
MRRWTARVLIAIVVAWNVQAALAFLLRPGAYAPGFQVSGAAGEAMVRGLGVLFLMWNVPYVVALWYPVRHRVSLYEACAMQGIGLIGESLIYLSLSPELAVARASVGRFILFDAPVGRCSPPRDHPAGRSAVSTHSVTGPSLTSSTSIIAWNWPVSTGTPSSRSLSTK